MLHVYGDTSRTIAFRKTPAGYRSISEQEIHTGPGWEQTVDGIFRERIIVEYQTEQVNGVPINQVWIQYRGTNSNLLNREKLPLSEVRPILVAWKTASLQPKPPDLPGAGFDPAPLMFVLMMVIMMLTACALAILVICGVLLLSTGLATAGILSVAVFTGAIKKSVSAGFRALILSVGAVGGLITGLLMAWLLTFTGWSIDSTFEQLLVGSVIGVALGLAAAFGLNAAWTRSADWVASYIHRQSESRREQKYQEPD